MKKIKYSRKRSAVTSILEILNGYETEKTTKSLESIEEAMRDRGYSYIRVRRTIHTLEKSGVIILSLDSSQPGKKFYHFPNQERVQAALYEFDKLIGMS